MSTEHVALAVNNLGLSTTKARYVQCRLQDHYDYNGALDGRLGSGSWKAMQRDLKAHWGYKGAIDGIVGSGTVKGLQRSMKKHQGYSGKIDGIAGPGDQGRVQAVRRRLQAVLLSTPGAVPAEWRVPGGAPLGALSRCVTREGGSSWPRVTRGERGAWPSARVRRAR
ncbi:hypothetical protein [Streptomyces scopuliridis]|uniref:hypothetical protein n=1 Tax=Streptomyces scopuliridis TaxID=452529 RepID=UPI003417FCFB